MDMAVDPSIAATLGTCFHVLEPSKQHYTGKLLPIINILRRNDFITKLNFPHRPALSGNTDANIIGLILSENKHITEVNLAYNNIGIDGLTSLCKGVQINTTLKRLDISGN
eukprot:CAMPEP_0116903432 /NCGR_PEP_ID=MMETSP0467-20121206/10734_1 /TAXON_ID=283647 /ORGANISM="Mesodinium pulex, Strain SPMC105" /LENGTH=110 /DNA_ID=CAMNT_0004577713 /DNA_START=226 /DNA_END=558 /DNA_ORIENTATION=+